MVHWYCNTYKLHYIVYTLSITDQCLISLQHVTAHALFSETSNIDYNSQTLASNAALENVTEYDNI